MYNNALYYIVEKVDVLCKTVQWATSKNSMRYEFNYRIERIRVVNAKTSHFIRVNKIKK